MTKDQKTYNWDYDNAPNHPEVDAVLDNGGETADRYTVFFNESYNDPEYDENHGPFYYCYGMSSAPSHPQGVCQFAGELSYGDGENWKHCGEPVAREDLPDAVVSMIRSIALTDHNA
jgi:hypothetical protein